MFEVFLIVPSSPQLVDEFALFNDQLVYNVITLHLHFIGRKSLNLWPIKRFVSYISYISIH